MPLVLVALLLLLLLVGGGRAGDEAAAPEEGNVRTGSMCGTPLESRGTAGDGPSVSGLLALPCME